MPEYTFYCDKENNGCGHKFTIFMYMCEYSETQQCPQCHKVQPVKRSLSDDLAGMTHSVIKGDDQITLGQLAERNRDRLSDDEKAYLNYKHNEYKFQPKPELPKGMTRMRKQEHDKHSYKKT